MPDAKRQRILDKIRKLQTKTTLMGCTEAEALAAAQAVGKLLDDYGLTMTDVELQSTECTEDSVLSPFVTNRHPIRYCLDAIAGYCHTEHFFSQRPLDAEWTTWRTAYSFFGLPHDVDLLIQLESGRSLLDIIAIKQDLEDLLERKVDVLTESAISPYLRERILHEAIPL